MTQVLFTILLAVAILTWARHRGSERRPAPERAKGRSPWYMRVLPAALLLGLLAAGGFTFWLEWQEKHRIFTVQVIDTRSGEVRTYPVYKGNIRGRTFETIDGRTVTLADVERMEVIEGAPAREAP